MAYSTASKTAADIALFNGDKPVLLGVNHLRDLAAATLQWRDTGSWASGATDTHADGPTSYLYDGLQHLQSYHDANGTTKYLIIDFGASGVSIDAIAIVNATYPASTTSISVEIADDNAFTTNLLEIASWTSAGSTLNRRMGALDLNTDSIYNSVRYCRIKCVSSSSGTWRFGEVFIGQVRQLKTQPNIPWGEHSLTGKIETFQTDSGVTTKNARRIGQRRLAATFNPHEDTYIDRFVNFFKNDITLGSEPFCWWDEPNTAPNAFEMMQLDNPELLVNVIGYTEREITMVAMEQGPSFRAGE